MSALASVSSIVGELDFDEYVADWLDHLAAENKSANTIATYGHGARSLRLFVVSKRWELDLAQITTKRLGAWQRHLLMTSSDATANNYYRGVKSLFAWLVNEGDLPASPFDTLGAPKIGEKTVPVIGIDDLRGLVKACDGPDFRDVRDLAIVRLFIDSGVRLAELTHVELDAIDKRAKTITVVGKGNRERVVPYGPKAAVALNRYLRLRARHRCASSPKLWLGKYGPMTRSGLYQVVRRRASMAGFVVHPHQFRHTFAHEWKLAGGNDSELMALCGWNDAKMLTRYGKSAASERARAAHARMGLGERV